MNTFDFNFGDDIDLDFLVDEAAIWRCRCV